MKIAYDPETDALIIVSQASGEREEVKLPA